MKGLIFYIAIALMGNTLIAQEDWLHLPAEKEDSTIVERHHLDYSQKNGTVIIKGNEKLIKLEEFVRSGEESVEGVKMDGFRVLIYFDQNKSSSESQKASFLSLYPEHKAYVDYLAPNYRVRAGNFRTKLEAEALKNSLLSAFPTAIVIADKIQLPKLPEPSDNSSLPEAPTR